MQLYCNDMQQFLANKPFKSQNMAWHGWVTGRLSGGCKETCIYCAKGCIWNKWM